MLCKTGGNANNSFTSHPSFAGRPGWRLDLAEDYGAPQATRSRQRSDRENGRRLTRMRRGNRDRVRLAQPTVAVAEGFPFRTLAGSARSEVGAILGSPDVIP